MHCQSIRQQLVVYRELNAVERERLEEHLATCASCAAALAAYRAQDQLLSSLPTVTPSPRLIEAVHARTTGRRRTARPFSWQRALAALTLLLCLSAAWATASRASGALPGDVLYPIKRGVEQVRLGLTFDPAAHERYQEELMATRQEEVRAIIILQRAAAVEFQGELVAVRADNWQVGGFEVSVGPQAWTGGPPPTGTLVMVEAQAEGGRLTARWVRLLSPGVTTPTPQAGLTGPPSPSRTPTARPRSGEATATPGGWGPGEQPSATPGGWGPGEQPSATPGAWGPEGQSSATPGAWGPGGQPSATPGAWGPGGQPSTTPSTPEPQPQLSATAGPAPQPSVTNGPGPHPSVTTGPAPQPSATTEPGPQPSATTGPQPSVTPGAQGPGPSVTPGAGGH